MKLRWKHFLVLVIASLVPLLAVTWITQNASRRLGKTISQRVQNTLTETVREEMVRATSSYAALSLLGGFASEQAIQRLAAQAELALALPPPPDTRIYYAADFDVPSAAPEDLAPSTNHPIRSEDDIVSHKLISREHPNFLLAPGSVEKDVANDIARGSRTDVCGVFQRPEGHHRGRRRAGLIFCRHRCFFYLPTEHKPYSEHHRRLETACERRLLGKAQGIHER